MKKQILWLFVLLILIAGVNAIDVSLNFPNTQTYSSSTDRIDFKCSASGGTIYEIELYTDISGGWAKTGNSCTDQENCTFIVLDVSAGNYKYNCFVNDMFWAPSNHSFIFTIINDAPEFNGTLENKNWSKNTVLNNVWDLDNYFSDPNEDPMTYNVHGNDKIDVEIISGVVKLTPLIDWTGSETINFSATDDKSAKTYSNNIILTVTGESTPPPSEDCDDNIDNDGDGNIDCQDSDCSSSPNNCQDATCNSTSYDWEYSLKSDADCDSDSDCDDDEDCDLTDCVCVAEDTTDDSDDTNDEESGIYIISSHSPSSDNINIKIGDSKKFEVTPSGDTEVKWYLDEEKVGDDNSYTFKPTEEGTYELVAVIGSSPSLSNNDDLYTWTITVGEEDILAGNICGNDKIDEGENCENCARDVKCANGEKCVNKECIESVGFFSGVSGFAVKTKDFVVNKWQYSSVIGGVIVVLIIFGVVYAGKRRKEDVLSEFGKEGFLSKIGKVFKRKKGYVKKKIDEKPTVEKQREVFIDKPFEDKKL